MERDELIFGRRPILEVLNSETGGKINKLWIQKGISGGVVEEILLGARQQKIVFQWVDRKRLSSIAGNVPHQGVVGRVTPFDYGDFYDLFERGNPTPVLLLDGIQDPQNLGAILRNAAFFGAGAVIIPRWRSAGLTGAVLKASAGALAKVPLIQVSNLAQTILDLKKKDYWVYGADSQGEDNASFSFNDPFALVVGAEGEGLHRLVKERCDALVKIGGTGAMESLNASCATGVLLYEIFRRRRSDAKG